MDTPKFISPALKDFDPAQYHFFGLWKQNLFSACFWVSCFSQEIVDKLGLESSEAGSLVLGEGNFFLKYSEINNIKKQIFQKIADRDEDFFKNMVLLSDRYFLASVEYGKTLKDKEINAENFQEYVERARDISLLWMLGAEQFSEAAEEKLSEVVAAESFPSERVTEIIPKFDTPLNQQHREVLELKEEVAGRSLEEIKRDPSLYAKLQNHAERFAWMEMANLAGESLTVERLYEQILYTKAEPVAAAQKLPPVSANLAFHARCMSYCGYIRQAGAEYFNMLSEKFLPHLRSIAKKFDLTHDEFLLQRDTEIMATIP